MLYEAKFSCNKIKKNCVILLLADKKSDNCCAPFLIRAPEDTAGHLRWSPLSESSLQEKLSTEMQFTAGVFGSLMYAYQNRSLYLICITMQITTVSNKAFVFMLSLYAALLNSELRLFFPQQNNISKGSKK